jgi:ABC-type multidrug transport system fused ATPase/permease subunit
LEQGKVKWSVYGEYAKMNNIYAVALYMFMLLASQTANIGGSVWLKEWSERNQESNSNDHVGKYIGIYFAFGIGASALTVIQTLILWIFCSIEASRKLHERMANAIFRSPMSFFDTTPAGRILNRFSRLVDNMCLLGPNTDSSSVTSTALMRSWLGPSTCSLSMPPDRVSL